MSQAAAKAIQEMLPRWRREHRQAVVEVSVHPRLERFGCKIESELGCIESGLRKQMGTMREAPSAGTWVQRPAPANDVDRVEKSGRK
jgi:flagellar biosynthesis/type III secretory pathway protein FliH